MLDYSISFNFIIAFAIAPGEKLNICKRSTHKIRKTYGTTLINSNVDEAVIINQMGHADIKTTKEYYYFSNRNKQEKVNQINNAISF